jgi:predicted nucleotidyltransferase
MKNWEVALDKFLKPWKENKEVIGIVVCGSYITGSPTKHSDIDLHIVLKRGCSWRERGNKIVDGILMEYFANPPEQIEKYMESDYKKRRTMDAHMFSTGKVLFDKDGEVEKLRVLARSYLKKSFDKMPSFKVEFGKYHLFDMADNLEEVFNRNTPDFDFVYFNFLNNLLEYYSEFLSFHLIGENKVYRFLTDKNDQKKYLIKKFSDENFRKRFVSAMCCKNKKDMLKEFKYLANYVQNKMGGFNIDGWKMRSPVDVK